MSLKRFHIFLFSLSILTVLSCTSQKPDQDKFRVIILTDMTHDDGNSLIRFLYYAPYFDLEAMIVTNQLPDFNYNDSGPWDKAMGILQAYKTELPQLRKHDSDFPDYEDLLTVTKQGRGALPIIWLTNQLKFSGHIADRYVESSWDSIYYHDWIGEGLNPNNELKDSEGSEFLQEVFAKNDDRPIFVQAWGGTVTFVQALYRYRQRQGEEKFQELLPKLHLYGILFQDISFEYFADFRILKENTCADLGSAIPSYNEKPVNLGSVLFDPGHFWQYCCSGDPAWKRPIYATEVNGHGPMSDIYDNGGEGDTPAFLYLLSSVFGLNDPLDPTQGSWGSMFSPMGEGFPNNYYSTCSHNVNELLRWIPDASNNFKNRLQWSIKDPKQVNKEPIAVINGDKTNNILSIKANPGETIILDASNSYDPNGDQIFYNWYRYHEADTYEGEYRLENSDGAVQKIVVPNDIENQRIHWILEIRDNGTPGLVAYRRIILSKAS